MKLRIFDLNLSTGGPLIAVLNEDDARHLDVYAGDRIVLQCLRKEVKTIAVVNISTKGIPKGKIGIFEETLKKLSIKEGTSIEVSIARRPKSIGYIHDKLEGRPLSKEQYAELIKDIVNDELSESELTYFVSACFTRGLSLQETAWITQAIVDNGETIRLGKVVADKHCLGGIPGNRTTPILISIIACLGFIMPKTSSRSITSPAGTADVLEVVTNVALSKEKIVEVVKKTNGCMVWGGRVNLAGADDKLIKIRHPLSLDPEGLMLASILAKKKSVGASHVLIDVPYGLGAKILCRAKARKIGRRFIKLGKMLGMKVRYALTDGTQPVGNGIGPALEISDVISVLKGNGPNDLREKSLLLASKLLEMLGMKNGMEKAVNALDSGEAYKKFIEIVEAQGGRKHIRIPKARLFYDICANKGGKVKGIDNKAIARIARIAGAPKDKVAGIYLRVHKGDYARKGEVLFTIYARSKAKLEMASLIAVKEKSVEI
ncbi:thymidine phosphorylase [archaeon]|nr:thymidine phosphorylase [archaeon]